jgi:uncharacterized protein YlxW (UPF0749 family)
MPVSFPVMSSRALTQRRSVFSSDYMQLTSSHVMSIPEAMTAGARRSRRVPVIEDSLQLLDDLTNRPVDPLFEDATLLKSRTQRPALKVISKVVTFLMCVLVGLGTFLAIQELHKDTRQKVREELANQVSDTLTKSDNLDKDVTDLKSQVTALSNKLAGEATNDSLTEQDALANATSEVSGAGLEVALADPRESDSEKGSSPRDSSSNIVVVTDTDLQRIVSILWSGGAEAISVNGVRLGVQSSVRAAGDAILVGVSPIQTPYTVSAIGDKATLRQALQTAETKKFFATLESEGIYPSISEKSSIKLKAASQPEVMYSERKQ